MGFKKILATAAILAVSYLPARADESVDLLQRELSLFGPWIRDAIPHVKIQFADQKDGIRAEYDEKTNTLTYHGLESIVTSTHHEWTHYFTDDTDERGLIYQPEYKGPNWEEIKQIIKSEETEDLRKFRYAQLLPVQQSCINYYVLQLQERIAFLQNQSTDYKGVKELLETMNNSKDLFVQASTFYSLKDLSLHDRAVQCGDILHKLRAADTAMEKAYKTIPESEKMGPLPAIKSCAEKDKALAVIGAALFDPKEIFARYVVGLMDVWTGQPQFERFPVTPGIGEKILSKMYWKNQPMFAPQWTRYQIALQMNDPEVRSRFMKYARSYDSPDNSYAIPPVPQLFTKKEK